MASLLPISQQAQQPVIVYLEDRTLIIDCLFRFNRRALREKPDPDHSETYASIISAGIVEKWHGTYPASVIPVSVRPANWHQPADLNVLNDDTMQNDDSVQIDDGMRIADTVQIDDTMQIDGTMQIDDTVKIDVRIRQLDPQQQFADLLAGFRHSWRQGIMTWLTRRRAVKISVRPMLFMPAHVISPLYRRIWGFLRTGQLESLGLNWSPRHPGRIVIPPYRQIWMIKAVAAHEAGHVFGLGDAYAAIYRFYHEAPTTNGYMMNNNQQVQAEEVRMLLQAHLTRRMQYFPRKWNTRRFFAGLVRDFRQRSQQAQTNWSDGKRSRLAAKQQKKDQRRNERR